MNDSIERPGATTWKGLPRTNVGPILRPGDAAPDFRVVDQSWKPITLADTGRRVRLFSVVPSLDTGICAAQTKRFDEELRGLVGKVGFYTVSTDLPWAQKRWCVESNVSEATVTLADHVEASFGAAYGTLVKEMRIESRAIFVLDAGGALRHVEYVKEIASHPNYDAALEVLRSLAS